MPGEDTFRPRITLTLTCESRRVLPSGNICTSGRYSNFLIYSIAPIPPPSSSCRTRQFHWEFRRNFYRVVKDSWVSESTFELQNTIEKGLLDETHNHRLRVSRY